MWTFWTPWTRELCEYAKGIAYLHREPVIGGMQFTLDFIGEGPFTKVWLGIGMSKWLSIEQPHRGVPKFVIRFTGAAHGQRVDPGHILSWLRQRRSSKPGTTIKINGHELPADDKAALELLERLFPKAGEV